MKNLFALLCCFPLLLSLVSCGDNKEDLVTAPSEEYIIGCLEKVPGIIEIKAVTEDTDPMNNLNKAGWYTANVYFSYQLVNQENVIGDDLIDKGTDAGGSIEVDKTKSEAKKRNEYLATFDGGILSPGSHTVVGTIVIRTSNELTASQQNLLERNIIAALTNETDAIVEPADTLDSDISNSVQEDTANVATYCDTYYMQDFANTYIQVFSDNTLVIYDADNRLKLQGYTKPFNYQYIPPNFSDYGNAYAYLKVDFSSFHPESLSYYECINILDDKTIIFNGYYFHK